MTTFRKAFIGAIVKSLLRGKSLIQAILAYWVSPLSPPSKSDPAAPKSLQDFLKDAETAILGPVSGSGLVQLSDNLRKQFFDGLRDNMQCMLPSYSHQLPTGMERGQYLALDVGGSTLRVALVELRGRSDDGANDGEIVSMHNYKISRDIKDLEGIAFFQWMATRIQETLAEVMTTETTAENPLPVALAWSFPIEYVSYMASTAHTSSIQTVKLTVSIDKLHSVVESCKEWARVSWLTWVSSAKI